MSVNLYTLEGQRKYLVTSERNDFLKSADTVEREVRTFCYVLIYGGCRISEALELTADRVDYNNGALIFRSLKKRKDSVYRSVPIPPTLLDMLDMVHDLKRGKPVRGRSTNKLLWDWSRATAWRRVKEVMDSAGIRGAHATPKGLRHSFGVHAVTRNVPLNKLQKWLGHADMKTTAIYADAIGKEEQQIAARMWD